MEKLLSNVVIAEDDYDIDPQDRSGPSSLPITTPAPPLPYLTPSVASEVDEGELTGSDDEAGAVKLVHGMEKLAIDPSLHRYFGKSSSAVMLIDARNTKKKYAEIHNYGNVPIPFEIQQRELWAPQPWVQEKIQSAKNDYKLPEQDLLWLLIDKYFTYVNAFLPLLHRPTFESHVSDGLHLRNGGFAGVVSLVCALGSRHTDDPRVLLPGTSDSTSAGWAWYDQVQLIRNAGLAPASIHDIQAHSVRFKQLPTRSWH